MSQNPINLAVRFLLEIAALIAIGFWGWTQHTGILRYILVFVLPLLAASLWGIFRVPEDASANRKAPVPIAGWLRLLLELAIFGFATWGLFDAGARFSAWIFGGAVIIHTLVSYDRIIWLMRQ
jgi:hypothetical protein